MGAGVSGWALAREVSSLGQIGVVSGTALDSILVRTIRRPTEARRRIKWRLARLFWAPPVVRRFLGASSQRYSNRTSTQGVDALHTAARHW